MEPLIQPLKLITTQNMPSGSNGSAATVLRISIIMMDITQDAADAALRATSTSGLEVRMAMAGRLDMATDGHITVHTATTIHIGDTIPSSTTPGTTIMAGVTQEITGPDITTVITMVTGTATTTVAAMVHRVTVVAVVETIMVIAEALAALDPLHQATGLPGD